MQSGRWESRAVSNTLLSLDCVPGMTSPSVRQRVISGFMSIGCNSIQEMSSIVVIMREI